MEINERPDNQIKLAPHESGASAAAALLEDANKSTIFQPHRGGDSWQGQHQWDKDQKAEDDYWKDFDKKMGKDGFDF